MKPQMTQTLPTYAALAHALRDQEVSTLFGLMGDANLFMVDHFVRELKGRYVPGVHEGGAVLMALGHAMASGEVGAVTITRGPAVSNAITALIEGTKGSVPIVLLCGDTPVEDPDHQQAVGEIARVLTPGGWLIGTVPAGPQQWSDWDEWAGHLRRYSAAEMKGILTSTGLESEVVVWGWPLLRLYDDFFLKRVNRRRLQHDGEVESDSTLSTVSALGRRRWLVSLVRSIFGFDRLFDGVPWGVGLLFVGRKKRVP